MAKRGPKPKVNPRLAAPATGAGAALSATVSSPLTGFFIAPGGSDTTGDGTEGDPWRTVSKFYTAAAAAGDTLYCRGGTYPAITSLLRVQNKSGSSGSPITVRNYPGEAPVFQGSGTHGFMLFEDGVSYWTIDGLTLEGFTVGSSGVIYIGDATVSTHHIIVRYCTVTLVNESTSPFNHCVYLSFNADDCTVEDNMMIGTEIDGSDGTAVNVGDHEPSPRRFLLQRNIIRGFYGDASAIWVNGDISDGSILHNTFMGPAQRFIRTPGYASAGAVIVRDNVGESSDFSEILDAGPGITEDHNYWDETLNGDGSLQAGSPAINGALDGSDAGAIPYP